MAKKLTQEDVEERFNTLHNGEFELLTPYINNQTPVTVKHKPCQYTYEIKRLDRFFNNSSYCCPNCQYTKPITKRMTEESFTNAVKEKLNLEFEYVSGFTKMHSPVTIKHSCGHTFEVYRATDVLSSRFAGCPNCREKRGMYQHDYNYLENSLNEALDGDEYEWLESFKSPKELHKIRHKKCGYEYNVRPVYFRYGDQIRCPKCARKQSKLEKEFISEIQKINKNLLIKTSDRTLINPFELDAYIPDKMLAIEFNGLHWHSEEQLNDRNYHYNKMKKCNDKGVQLIQIFEDDWAENKDVLLNFFQKILTSKSKYNIDNIEFRELDIKIDSELINSQCLFNMKNIIFTNIYGAFINNECITIFYIDENRISNSIIDILLYSDIFEKFLEFLKNLKKHDIIDIEVNNCHYNNSKYLETLGFLPIICNTPSFAYTDGHKRYYDLYDDNQLIPEFYEIVWDAGTTVYEYKLF